MRIRILGSAAGGGYPQWNCNCDSCARVWRGEAKAQTQVSLAVTADDAHWFLLNASPDLRAQILANAVICIPQAPGRHSPIAGAVLTNGDVDAVAGLLDLRESQKLAVYATRAVLGVLEANSIFKVLNPDFVARRALTLDAAIDLTTRDGADYRACASPRSACRASPRFISKARISRAHLAERSENTIGLEIAETASGKIFFFIPGCAAIDAPLKARLNGAALLFFDGTLWRDDEMIRAGLGAKTGKRMGHVSAGDSIAGLADCGIARKIFVHINNTNPLHRADSAEHAKAREAGWEIGRDGMEIVLNKSSAAAWRLARLGGSQPDLKPTPRRRSKPAS